MSILTVERKVLEKNEKIAADLRTMFAEKQILVINLLSSPGSGKTTILERTLQAIKSDVRIAVIEGDVQTDRDARRIDAIGVPVVQIVTHGGCHLDAMLVSDALKKLTTDDLEILIIENVGNLVCPASYDLGEKYKVVIASTTEGDDKPLKYPKMFHVAELCLINKIDLLPYVDFDVEKFKENALKINPGLTFFQLSAKTGSGVDGWVSWLLDKR